MLEQANLGGSGGFSRAMLETLDGGRSDYVLLLDDDVVCEPEGIARAVAFADLARRPTIVGGHMFSMYERSVLHAFAEVVLPWQFRWAAAAVHRHSHDLVDGQPALDAVAAPAHRRRLQRLVDVPHPDDGAARRGAVAAGLHQVGRRGVRAARGAAGYPTVSLPGAAVWHVPWTDKDDSVDWQAYFHARNRFVAALLHSPFRFGGRMVRESLAIQAKHLMGMQYSAAPAAPASPRGRARRAGEPARRPAHAARRGAPAAGQPG